ncbi:MAG: hypothetical protein K6G11_07730, partial [Lachnospiraceae bacterium]|nr:hypothetical protein [Lachnospiraceae bacterium]
YKVSGSGLAGGDKISEINFTGSQTEKGESDNTFDSVKIINSSNEIVTDCYEITKVYKKLIVGSGKAITLKTASAEKVYDGTPLTANTVNDVSIVSGELAEGNYIDSVVINSKITNAGLVANELTSVVIKNSNGTDVTANYTIAKETGTLTVTQKEITVTAVDAEKTYDGTALSLAKYTVKDGDGNNESEEITSAETISYDNATTALALADGDKLAATVTGERILAGGTDNTVGSIKIYNSSKEDVTENYNINKVNGTLVVNPRSIVIKATDATKTYDGTALTYEGKTLTSELYTLLNPEGNQIELCKRADNSTDTLTSLTFTGEQTVVNSGSTTLNNIPSDARIYNGTEDVTGSYDITYKGGILTVTQKEITITANSESKVYDGTALENSGCEVTGGLGTDTLASITVTGSQKHVNTGSTTITPNNIISNAVIINSGGDDVTSSYKINYVNGTLAVSQRPITIEAVSKSKSYDGTALTCNDYIIHDSGEEDKGLASTDKISAITITGSQTTVGEHPNAITENSVRITNNLSEDVTGDYNITLINGKLTVGQGTSITLTAGSDSKTYDGTPLTCSDYEITRGKLATGHRISKIGFTSTSTITDAGTVSNVIDKATIKVVDDNNKDSEGNPVDVTSNYTFATLTGDLTINKADIKVTALDRTKVYDGTALAGDTYTIANADESIVLKMSKSDTTDKEIVKGNSSLGFDKLLAKVLGEGGAVKTVTFAGSVTEADEENVNINSITLVIPASTDNSTAEKDITGNFNITYVQGTLSVTARYIKVKAVDSSKEFDGEALKGSLVRLSDESETIVLEMSLPSAATTVKNVIKGEGNFDTLLEKLIGDDNAVSDIKLSGSQTEAGVSSVTPYGLVVKDDSNKDITSSFNPDYVSGLLEVTQKALKVEAVDAKKTYDGTALTSKVYTISNSDGSIVLQCGPDADDNKIVTNTSTDVTDTTYSGLMKVLIGDGNTIDSIKFSGQRVLAGTSVNTISNLVIKNSSGDDITSTFDITYTNGDLTVNKRKITINAGDATKPYDGETLTCENYSVSGELLADGDSVSAIQFSGSQTEKGSSKNTVVEGSVKIVDSNKAEVTSSYEISYAEGTLTVGGEG